MSVAARGAATQITIWDQKFRVRMQLDGFDLLRVALEAAIAAQLALFALFLVAGADKSRPAGFFLAAICAGLFVAVALNALASAGVAAPLRRLNYFIDLALGPLVLGFAARAAADVAPVRRADLVHAVILVLGALVLVSNWEYGPDLYVIAVATSYLAAAAWMALRRRETLRAAGLLRFTATLLGAFALVTLLRVWVAIDARALQSYRDSAGYVAILAVAFGLAAFMLWAALRKPDLLAWRAALQPKLPDDEARALEAALSQLMDSEKLYLTADLTLAAVAERLRVPARRVSLLISSRFGENFSSYVNRKRAEAAATALRAPERLPVTTIMYDCGFGSKSAFQREFRRCFGVSPTEYRRGAEGA